MQIQRGIEPLTGGEKEWGVVRIDKGQSMCVLHLAYLLLKRKLKVPYSSALLGEEREEEEEGDGCPEKQFSVLMQTNSSLRPRTIIS